MTDQITTSDPTAASSSGKAEQAKHVAGDALQRGQGVAGEAGAQAKAVARDARAQVRDVVGRTRQSVDLEARNRSRQAAGSLRTFADQLGALAEGDSMRAGALADYARDGRDRLSRLAERLEDGPSAVFDDMRRFARRQPALFLAAAGATGFVVGRLLRAGKEGMDNEPTADGQYDPYALAAPAPDSLVVPPDVPPVSPAGTTAGVEGLAP